MSRHPSTEAVVRWFDTSHQSPEIQKISKPFQDLANRLLDELPDSAELTASLRKLLESKDCAVRATVATQDQEATSND